MSAEDVLRFVNLLASGIAAGVLVSVLVAVIPVLAAVGAGQAITIKKTLDPLIDRVNPPAVALAIVTGILILILGDELPTMTIAFTGVGIGGSLGIVVTSLGVNMRLNRTMHGWSSDDPPASYAPAQERWNRFHAVRTASGLVAFAGFVVAALA